jgi:DNA-binding MarR family transcriptional regulator
MSSTCSCVALRRAARTITHLYDTLLEPSGLNVTQLSLLRQVRRLGAPNISTLAETQQLDRTTLSRNLAVLERAGLVAIAAGDDLRARTVSLTEQGAQALDAAAPLWDAAQARIAEHLGHERLQQLEELLADVETLTR